MSAYTAIEPDVPVNELNSSTTKPAASENPYTYASGTMDTTTTPAATNPDEWTWAQRLRESSHPVALLVYMFFRVFPIFVYIFGNFFIGFITKKNRFILHFIVLILLNAADFWNLKNIAGRLLVGLRWWNETDPRETGEVENVWVFETANPDRYINPIDSRLFWMLLYGQPIAWMLLGILAVLKFEFLYLILITITISLSVTNAVAFTRCDKFGKANLVANSFMANARNSLLSRLNPFA